MDSTEKRKAIAIGMEDFKEIISKNGYFVDKTLLIKKLIENKTKVTLFTRPRRFGKTLNQSMIRRFFEDERTEQGEQIDNGHLFDGLAISRCGEEILKHQQQYPVIFLSLKSAKQPDFEMAYKSLLDEISKEFKRHKYVLNNEVLSKAEKNDFELICDKKAEPIAYAKALGFLSECLAKCHGKNTIILIDEFDVPLENAYFRGFYNEMIDFIRSLFESALKTNLYLERGVITGCLRISKESIFAGLNNLEVQSILGTNYPECFGFTEPEVKEMTEYFGFADKYPELKEWYDGYCFGEDTEIYNPWSILSYLRTAEGSRKALPRPYWSNTSSNDIIREMVQDADAKTRKELEILMNGGTIEKPVHEEITYGDIHASMDNLWNFLFFTGYLKKINERQEGTRIMLRLAIPNLEIASVYENSIFQWFNEKTSHLNTSALIEALEQGDCRAAENFISGQLMQTISYYDYAENYYHGFLAGLLTNAGRYLVESNRESGTGRPDLVLYTANVRGGRVILLELKVAENIAAMEKACSAGLAQIETQRYAEPFQQEGYPDILKYALSFCKKDCMVRKG